MLDDDKVKNTDIDMYMFLVIFRCEDAPCARVRRDYCKIEPCDVIQRPIDVVFGAPRYRIMSNIQLLLTK